jgi:hypothetical protein
MKRKTDGG